MEIKMTLRRLFYPQRCMCCGKVTEPEVFCCDECKRNLSRIEDERCSVCGCGKEFCVCEKSKMHYDALAAPFYYEGAAKNAVLRLKSNASCAPPMAREMAETVNKYYGADFDAVCFVPMSKKRFSECAFNHSEILADEIGKIMNIPAESLLKVVIDSPAQHLMPKEYRSGNVRGIYDIIDDRSVSGKKILLADDIKTTGATLSECALILKLYGAKSVCAVTAAIVKQKGKKWIWE